MTVSRKNYALFSDIDLSKNLDEISTISKARLFEQWNDLMRRIKSMDEIPKIYSQAKGLATDYQMAKMQVIKAFENNGLGQWIVTIPSRNRISHVC